MLTKFCLCVKVPFKSNTNGLSTEVKKYRLNMKKNLKAFIDYSQIIDDVYKNLEDYITQ